MLDRVHTLTVREREALRLLLLGHDAKSSARHLGLSVHTVNDRLRDARRKLCVSSSLEAARMLAAVEQAAPDLFGSKDLGVAEQHDTEPNDGRTRRRGDVARSLAWFSGGMLVMSLIIASLIFVSLAPKSAAIVHPTASPVEADADAAKAASLPAAIAWLNLIDRQRWDDSWRAAAGTFQSNVSAKQWAAMIRPIRQSLGAVTRRQIVTATRATKLPGVPDGAYEILQFNTDFATKRGAVETVTMVREGTTWKVAGYFIR